MKRLLYLPILLFFFILNNQQFFAQSCGTRQLDPKIAAALLSIDYKDQSLEELRNTPIEQLRSTSLPMIPYPQENVKRLKITKDSIPILAFNATHQKGIPVIINYHGGGFIIPLVPELEHSLWLDSKTYGAIIFAVDYRVAPENKFPAAVNDSYAAFKWISDHAGKFGGDTSRVALMGLSAGANLVAVISQKAKKDGIAGKIKAQIMNGVAIDARPENMETSLSYQ